MATDQVTISNGTLTADTVNVTTQLYTNAISVTGNAAVEGNLLLDGQDVLSRINAQNAKLEEHASLMGQSTSPHLTVAEHTQLAQVTDLFNTYTNVPVTPVVDSPDTAISQSYFPTLFRNRAMANWDLEIAPGHVFASRVPYAFKIANGGLSATESFIALSQAGSNPLFENMEAKLLDNVFPDGTPRQHRCSTDTVEGVDDYVGKEWAFFWEYGNYISDDYGVKHLTSVRGAKPTHDGYTAPDFNILENTAAFGPAFWFFCKPIKKYTLYNNGTVTDYYLTDDGTADGNAFTQIWGISDSPWNTIDETHENYNGITYPGLSDAKKEALEGIGIYEEDFHLWPSCKIYVPETTAEDGTVTPEHWLIRPYWCHSAFNGGSWESYEDATLSTVVSVVNAPLKNKISYQNLNAGYGAAVSNIYPGKGRGGSANVNGFGMLFDIVKNATKDSQSIHYGLANGNTGATIANYSLTAEENARMVELYGGYIFPVSSTSNFNVGRTVRLGNVNTNAMNGTHFPVTYTRQIGRIKALRTDVEFTDRDGNTVTGATAIIIDPGTDTCNEVQPFHVFTSAADQSEFLATEGNETQYACCYAGAIYAMAGETMNYGVEYSYTQSGTTVTGSGVIGYHDGSIVSNTSGRYLYRVQGTEYMPGTWAVAADTVARRGADVEVTLADGSTYTPTSSEYVVFTCPPTKSRRSSGSFTDFLNAGYEATGIIPTVSTGWILNSQLSPNGVAYPALLGGNSNQGTRDSVPFSGAASAVFLMDGYFGNGDSAGSSHRNLNQDLGSDSLVFAARD